MELLDWLPSLFDQKNARGELKYSDAEMRDFLAAMLLSQGFEADELPPECERLIADLARRAGVDPTQPREDCRRALERYFEEHPLNQELVIAFRQNLRAAFVRESGGSIAKAFAKYIEAGERKLFEERAPPREGAVRGGPLGFFLAKKKVGAD